LTARPSNTNLGERVLEISSQGEGRQLIPHFPKHFLSVLVELLKTLLFIETRRTHVKGDLVRRSTHFGPAKYNVCSAFLPAGYFLRVEPTYKNADFCSIQPPSPMFLEVSLPQGGKGQQRPTKIKTWRHWLTTSPSKR